MTRTSLFYTKEKSVTEGSIVIARISLHRIQYRYREVLLYSRFVPQSVLVATRLAGGVGTTMFLFQRLLPPAPTVAPIAAVASTILRRLFYNSHVHAPSVRYR